MYSRLTKDNKKWCDLANLTNVYNSDNIHRYMVNNKSQGIFRTIIWRTIAMKSNHWIILFKAVLNNPYHGVHRFSVHPRIPGGNAVTAYSYQQYIIL